ncbi:hypothetical protein E2C01_079616 [Portunus trituberculatus]|uniref:Uncharacterized protein n=1 Tax=Portunus trituberculatus TaxID=210409 RepID=A0A5B7IT87_PORTR|nr:hypothetical protein [Portunus trituberculatus]
MKKNLARQRYFTSFTSKIVQNARETHHLTCQSESVSSGRRYRDIVLYLRPRPFTARLTRDTPTTTTTAATPQPPPPLPLPCFPSSLTATEGKSLPLLPGISYSKAQFRDLPRLGNKSLSLPHISESYWVEWWSFQLAGGRRGGGKSVGQT